MTQNKGKKIHLLCKYTKGHLISEQIWEDIDFPKSQRKYCQDFFPESFNRLGQKSQPYFGCNFGKSMF